MHNIIMYLIRYGVAQKMYDLHSSPAGVGLRRGLGVSVGIWEQNPRSKGNRDWLKERLGSVILLDGRNLEDKGKVFATLHVVQ